MDCAHSSRTASDATTPSSPSLFDDDVPPMVKLSFSKNSVYNTVISSEDHDIMYKVTTPNRFLDRVTSIYRMDRASGQAQFAGEIAWKTLDPQVRIGWQNCEWMPVRQWLRSPRGELSTSVCDVRPRLLFLTSDQLWEWVQRQDLQRPKRRPISMETETVATARKCGTQPRLDVNVHPASTVDPSGRSSCSNATASSSNVPSTYTGQVLPCRSNTLRRDLVRRPAESRLHNRSVMIAGTPSQLTSLLLLLVSLLIMEKQARDA